MSIIERSLQKLAHSHVRPDGLARPDGLVAPRRPSRPMPPPSEPARTFQPVQLAAHTLEVNRILAGIADPAATSAYKMLRTRLLQRVTTHNWRAIGVTGTVAGEGKSLTAINLALALARDVNTHVFLVDMDLQRPAVAAHLGMPFDKGLSDYLLGDASLDEIIYSPGIDRLAIIPNANRANHSSELLGSPRMDELLAALAQEQPPRIIICDMPPLMVSDDVLTLAPRIDGLLLVVSQGLTDRKVLESAREMLGEMNLLGVVLNRSTENEKHRYGYDYQT